MLRTNSKVKLMMRNQLICRQKKSLRNLNLPGLFGPFCDSRETGTIQYVTPCGIALVLLFITLKYLGLIR
jgi:hypothetical protein